MTFRTTLLLAGALAAGSVLAHHAGQHPTHEAAASPYAGMETREIKALSPEETRGLLEGQGMRLALAAELNGYPGPTHVLELADALQLTAHQREQTRALMQAHKAEARALGAQALAAERDLDRAFAQRTVTEPALTQLTERIGQVQARLRAAHLRTHLQQAALLTPEQVAQYQRLRGYHGGHAGHGSHGGRH